MGLDDLVDDEVEEQDEEAVNTLTDELGIEDREELEMLDERLDDAFQASMQNDRRIEKLEGRVDSLEQLIHMLLKRMKSLEEEHGSKGLEEQNEWELGD